MAQTLNLTCIKPGGGAFIVDGGRPGYRHLGIAEGGAADPRAMKLANRLLGRDPLATCLELTMAGGHWLLSGQGQFVLTGADMNWRLNGRLVEAHQVQYFDGDGLLTATSARRGLRSYLAINGNWDLPLELSSSERGHPGIEDISYGWSVAIKWEAEAPFQMDLDVDQFYPSQPQTLRVVPGPEWSLLTDSQQKWLIGQEFNVHPDSSRQGIRLIAPFGPELTFPTMLSSPVLPGTVQLTPAGPILLGPDAQTIGGYPRVLLVEAQDALAIAFQVAVGGEIRFTLT